MTSFFAQSFEYFSNKPESVCAFLATTRSIFHSSIIPVTLNMEELWYKLAFDERIKAEIGIVRTSLLQVFALSHTVQFTPSLTISTSPEATIDETVITDLVKTLIHERRYFCRTLKKLTTMHHTAFELVCEHVPCLETLHCPFSDISDWQPIARLTSLREVQLTITSVDDNHLQHLAGLTSLEILSLEATCAKGVGFVHFGGMKLLRVLNISRMMRLRDEGLLCLPELPSLTELNLASSYKITDVGFAAVTKQKNLRTLNVSACSAVSMEGFKGLSDLRDLTDLDMWGYRDDGDACLSILATIDDCSLRKLTIATCPSVSDEGIAMIVNEMKELVFLDVSECEKIADNSLKAISTLRFLTELKILGLPEVSDEGIRHLKNCPCLDTIEFGDGCYENNCSHLSLEAFSQMKNLKTLVLHDEDKFNDNDIAKLADSISLESLTLEGSHSNLTNDAILSLSKSKSLRIIRIHLSCDTDSEMTKEAEQFFVGTKIHFELTQF